MNTSTLLQHIFESLLAFYGPQHWWPADTPFEVMVGAILTQNTAWTSVEKAIARLADICDMTPQGILALPSAQLEEAIRPSGYFRQKAQRLRHLCGYLLERYGGMIPNMNGIPIARLRVELLRLHGIGPETADSILLYALEKPVFVVDAYTVRLCSRLGMIDGNSKYARVQSLFMDNLEPDVTTFNEYHALMVKHGKERCRKRAPLCKECPLGDMCPSYFKFQNSNFK